MAKNQRHTITRNASFFEKIKENRREPDEDEIFNSQTTTAEMNNEMQAPIDNQVEAPALRRSTRNHIQREQYENPINPDLIIR